MSLDDYESDEPEPDDERDELLRERAFNRRRHNAFMAHPDPRDPDYPGDD